MNNVKQQFNTLNAAHAYSQKHDDPVGVLKILIGYEEVKTITMDNQECITCGTIHEEDGYGYHDDGEECVESNYERDYDLELKDAEVMAEIYD